MLALKLKIIIIVCITMGITACSTSTNRFSHALGFPTKNKTQMTDYLGCFGDMLTSYRKSGNELDLLRLAVVSVKDSTNVSTTQSNFPSEIPSDFTDMALNITSKIGGPIRIVHIPSSQELFDAARYGAIPGKKPPFLNTFNATHYRGDTLQLYGALTEYDRISGNQTRDGDLSVEAGSGSGITNLEISATEVVNVARMTMDFRVAYAAAGDVVNHSSSSNTVTVYQRGSDRSFGLSVDGNSIGYSNSTSIVDARHKAIRLLIEWGLIETLGRYSLVPYWKCLPNSNNTPLIAFKDIVGSNGFYNFQTKRAGAIKRPGNQYTDMRDKTLINSVISDFQNAEYLHNATRKLVRRNEKNSTLIQRVNLGGKAVDRESQIEGKSTLRKKLLAPYKRQQQYSKMSDAVLLKTLRNKFIKAKILDTKDNLMSVNTYVALWLNVPIVKGGRWSR